jgi:hypothetical protein
VNRTRSRPSTVPSVGWTSTLSVYLGRAGSGAARRGVAGHPTVVACGRTLVLVVLLLDEVGGAAETGPLL